MRQTVGLSSAVVERIEPQPLDDSRRFRNRVQKSEQSALVEEGDIAVDDRRKICRVGVAAREHRAAGSIGWPYVCPHQAAQKISVGAAPLACQFVRESFNLRELPLGQVEAELC
jgi:hypothetical protein